MADISIGNLYAELAFDTSGLEKGKADAIAQLNKLKAEEERITREMGDNITENMKIKINAIKENQAQCIKIIESLEEDLKKKRAADLKALGDTLMTHVTGPLKKFAEDAIATFANFEQSMQNVFSVMGASEQDMELLTATAKKMGETTRFSASQAADALYSLGSAGQTAEQATKSLQGVLRLAGATGSDLAYTSETIASTLSQFNLEANKASHIANVFSMAISKSQANMTKLSYSMKYVGPVASGLGISLESTTAALMQLYNTGFGGEQAGTYLRNALQKLASGTDELKNKLAELGISYDEVNPQAVNFANILNTLKEHGVGVAEAISIFGEASGGAMAKLIEGGGDAVSTMEGVLAHSEGSAEAMQKIQNMSFANTQAELNSAFEAVKISIGEILMPAINFIAQGFTTILKTINDLPVGVKTFAVSLGVIVAFIGVLLTVPALINAITVAMQILNTTMLANPIFLGMAVIATIAAAVYAIVSNAESQYESILNNAKKEVEEIKKLQEEATEAGNKGRAINDLLEKYEKMSRITNKTKDEQAEYNSTLEQLQKLVPDIVLGVNEIGEAYIKNYAQIKLMGEQYLRNEKELNDRALAKARVVQTSMEGVLKSVQPQIDAMTKAQNSLFKELEVFNKGNTELNARLNAPNDTTDEKITKFKNILQGDNDINKAFRPALKYYVEYINGKYYSTEAELKAMMDDWIKNIQGVDGIKSIQHVMAKYSDNLLASSNRMGESFSGLVEIQTNALKAKEDVKVFEHIRDQIEEARNAKEAERESKQAIIEKLKDAMKKEVAQDTIWKKGTLDELLFKYLKALREKAQDVEATSTKEGEKILPKDIEKVILGKIKGIENNPYEKYNLERLYDELNKKRATPNTSAPKPKQESKDDSLQAELKALDDGYQLEIKLAKEYGDDTLLIEAEWYEKRKELLQNKMDEHYGIVNKKYKEEIEALKEKLKEQEELLKNGQGNMEDVLNAKKAIQEKREEIPKENYSKYTLEGNGEKKDVTIQQEFDKTASMQKVAFDGLKTKAAQQEEKLQNIKMELNNVIGQIAEAKANLTELEAAPVTDENNEKIKLAKRAIEELENRAKELATALGQNFTTLSDVDSAMARLEGKQTPSFISKLKELKKEKKKILALIQQAEKNPTTDKELAKLKKRHKELEKYIREGNAAVANSLMSSINTIATKMTSLALEVYETGELNAESTIDIFLEGINIAMQHVTNQTALAVLGAIAVALNVAKMIVSFVLKKKKEEEEAEEKREQERKRKRVEEANIIAGDTAKIYAKHIDPVGKRLNNMDAIFNEMLSQTRLNKVNNFLQNLGTMKIKFGAFGHLSDSINEVIADYNKAIEAGNMQLALALEKQINYMTRLAMEQKGITPEDLDGLKNYIQDINKVMIEAVQNGDFSTLGVLLKEKLREAIYSKFQGKIIDDKIKKMMADFDKAPNDAKREDIIKKAVDELEKETKRLDDHMTKFLGVLGRANTEMDEHTKRWAELKTSIGEALSESLSESAYSADWSSFKKAFASEMKKAIVDAVISQAGIRTKINAIIKGIMDDGKITAGEIDASLNELRGIYDSVEGSLESVAQMLKKLEEGVDVKQEVQGTIIQKLSGADRDYFSDMFKDNFKLMLEGFKMAILDLKEIRYAQITVLNATLNVNTVNLYATDNMSLKEFLAELINEARLRA